MGITITLGWWVVPTMITLLSVGYAVFGHNDGGGWLSGIGNLLLLVPALGASLVAWIIYAALK